MLPLIQLIIAILLIAMILLQQRGSGLGSAFGGEGSIYRTKRGAEKTIFTLTIILAILFLGLALINVYLSSQDSAEINLTEPKDETSPEASAEAEPAELLQDEILMEGEDIEEEELEEDDISNIFDLGE